MKNLNFLCRKLLTAYLVFLCCIVATKGQIPKIRFHTIDIQNKLANNYVNCSLLDSKGFLWFGTYEGLSRYDGYNFKLYRHSNYDSSTIAGNFITTLSEDQFKNIWIGTSSNGISILDPRTGNIKKIKSGSKEADLPSDYVNCLFRDSHNIIWIGMFNGLCRFDAAHNRFVRIRSDDLNTKAILSIYEDKSQRLWIGTNKGLSVFNRSKDQFESFDNSQSLTVRGILEDNNGNIWFATDNEGIRKFNPKTKHYHVYQNKKNDPGSLGDNQVWSLFQDSKNNIWAGTINGGLNLYNPISDNFVRYNYSKNNSNSIPSNSITSILEDRSGNLWFTTHGGGVAFKNASDDAFELFKADAGKNSLSHSIVKCFYEDTTGRIWIGTDGGGIHILDRNTGNMKVLGTENGLSSNVIIDICKINNDNIAIATWKGGICLLNIRNFKVEVYKNDPNNIYSLSFNNVYDIFKAPDDKLWIVTHGGGINIFLKDKRFINYRNHPELNLNLPQWGTSLVADEHDTLWASVYGGLYKIKDFRYTFYWHNAADSSLSGYYVYAAYRDKNNRIWFATDNGLDLYNPKNQKFINITARNNILGAVKSIIDDNDGNIWFTIGNQLYRLKNNKFYTFSLIQHGQYIEKASFRSSNGDLFFGSTDGFVIVHPDRLKQNETILPVFLTDFQVLNVSQKPGKPGSVLNSDISETETVKLKYDQSSFSVEFLAINYSLPSQIKYSYKLEGFDKDWISADESRKAIYTNLNPGTFTFKVKAANQDGKWNESNPVNIVILSPFWLTPWAYGLYALIIVMALTGYRRFIIFKERLKAEVESRRELDRLKTDFFTNVSHELRTPLTLILGPVEHILKTQTRKNETEQIQLNLIHRNARRLLILVNQLLDFSKIESGKVKLEAQQSDIIEFIKSISEPFIALANEKEIKLALYFHAEHMQFWFDPDKMEKVITNLLANAIKNTNPKGSVFVKTNSTENQFTIEVNDTGTGIPENDLPHIFERFYQVNGQERKQPGTGIGLSLTKELVELHRGTIEVKSVEGKGSSFLISLPDNHLLLNENEKEPHENILPPELTGTVIPETISNHRDLPLLLIVDDNDDIRKYITSNLGNYYKILEASDGLHGIELASEYMPDIIISDIMMPLVNGLDFCRHIKSERRTSHIPIILLTAKSSNESKIEGFETGADDYLVKPFSIDVLSARLKNLLEARKRLKELYRKDITLEPEQFTNNDTDSELIRKIYGIVELNLSNPEFNPDRLAKELLMSRSSLYLKIKAISGESVSIFVRNIRLKRAAMLIKQKKLPISEIAYDVGFNQVPYFSKCFKEVFGVSPSEYK